MIGLFPAIPSLLYLIFADSPPLQNQQGGLMAVLVYILSRTDSGGQMSSGPGLLRVLALLAGSLWLLRLRDLPHRMSRATLLIGIGFGLSLLSCVVCSHPHDALLAWLDWLSVVLCVVISAELAHHSEASPLLYAPFVVVALAFLLVPSCFLQYLQFPAADDQMRGSFFHPNMLATYLLMLFPSLLLEYLGDEDRPASYRVVLNGTLLVVVTGCVLLTLSRGAILIGIVLYFASLALARQVSSRRLAVAGLAMGTCVLLLRQTALHPSVGPLGLLVGALWTLALLRAWPRPVVPVGRLLVAALMVWGLVVTLDVGQGTVAQLAMNRARTMSEGSDSSASARHAFWGAALRMGLDHPWLGVGPDGFQRYFPAYQTDLLWFSKFCHNQPLCWLAETGLPSTLLILTGFGWWIALAWRLWYGDPAGPEKSARLSLLLGVLGFWAYSCLDVQWQFQALPLTMALMLGVALGTPRLIPALPVQEEPDEAEEEPLSAWAIRPQVLLQHTLSVVLLGFLFFSYRTTDSEFWCNMGKFASENGHHKEAVTFYRQAILLDPWQSENFRLGALAVLNSGGGQDKERAEVIEMARRATELDRHRAVNYNLLGRLLNNSDGEAAGQAFQTALELDPVNYPSFYSDMAANLLTRKLEARARRVFEVSFARFPESALSQMFDFRAQSIRNQLAEAYLILGDVTDPNRNPDEAEPLMRRATELNPKQRNAWLGLGIALMRQGRYQQASQAVDRLLSLNPRDSMGMRLQADLLDQLGRTTEAAALRREADRLDPPTDSGAVKPPVVPPPDPPK